MKLKSLIIYFVTVVFLLSNSVGLMVVYNQVKFYHKRVIKEQIRANKINQIIEVLGFSRKDLQGNKIDVKFIEENEFRYNGKFYDVISRWETEDSIFYRCINDSKEEELEEIFVRYVVNNNHRNDLPLPIKQLIDSLQIEYYLVSNQKNNPQLSSFIISFDDVKKPVNQFLVKPDPPPRSMA